MEPENPQNGAPRCALLIVDLINEFDFEDADKLLRAARPAVRAVARLKARAARRGLPVVYVNDNFGRWREDFKDVVRRCTRRSAPGRALVEQILPDARDYFVLKPSNSGFFGTALEVLLRHLRVDTLILTGVATDNCVLFTAHDAYLRRFRLFVPEDCSAANTPVLHRRSLRLLERTMKADVRRSTRLRLTALTRARARTLQG